MALVPCCTEASAEEIRDLVLAAGRPVLFAPDPVFAGQSAL